MKTNTKIGIILCFDSEYCCKPENFLNSICSEIKKELQVNLTIGYGEFVDDIKDLRSSRKNALYALERTFVVQGACVVSYRQVNIYENKVLLINWNSQALINAIEYFDTEQIQSQIDAFTAELAEKSPPGMPYLTWYSVLFSVCARLSSAEAVYPKKYSAILRSETLLSSR